MWWQVVQCAHAGLCSTIYCQSIVSVIGCIMFSTKVFRQFDIRYNDKKHRNKVYAYCNQKRIQEERGGGGSVSRYSFLFYFKANNIQISKTSILCSFLIFFGELEVGHHLSWYIIFYSIQAYILHFFNKMVKLKTYLIYNQ